MKIYLDGNQFTDKETSYTYLIQELDLPDYTGHNLDALWDVFTEPASFPKDIIITNARQILDNLEDYGRSLLDLLGDVSKETGHIITFKW